MLHNKILSYPVVVTEEPTGGYVVTCPTLEGCYSQGETIEEALKNIREAIALCTEEQPRRVLQPASVSLHMVKV